MNGLVISVVVVLENRRWELHMLKSLQAKKLGKGKVLSFVKTT